MAHFDLAYNSALAQGSRLLWSNPASGTVTTYTEVARYDDTSADYRTAGNADYVTHGGASVCFSRVPLNNVADPFPLNTSKTYRLRYVQGGSATQANAQIIGTPTQTHIDTSPGTGIACYRFGTVDDMIAVFGNPTGNPHSPPSFNGGQWILEEQTITTNTPDNLPRLCREPFTTTQNTYTELLRRNVGGSNNINEADYYAQTSGALKYQGAWFCNNGNAQGTFSIPNANATGTFRLRLVGNSGFPNGAEVVAVGLSVDYENNRAAIRVGSIQQMRTAFGNPPPTQSIGGSSGGQIILERQTGSTTVTGKRLAWKPRTALTANDVVYARDDVANNLIWRTVSVPA